MKRISILLLLIIAVGIPAFAQELNIDSILKVVISANSAQKNNPVLNKDSLFKRLPVTTSGRARVKLIYDLYDARYKNCDDNVEMGYRILAWAK
jgi:hypothetical protein